FRVIQRVSRPADAIIIIIICKSNVFIALIDTDNPPALARRIFFARFSPDIV
ncbi:hypothetical protein PSYAR_05350, partial [Pseudomonas syringae pv. aceris str. M302273]